MSRTVFVEIASALLILLFFYAAFSKLLDFDHFSIVLGKSPLLTVAPRFIAIAVPLSEILISVLLLFRKSRLAGLYLSLFLLSLFTCYLITILNFSTYIPCSCGGIIGHMNWKAHIIFNVAFMVLNMTAIFFFNARQPITLSAVEVLSNN